MLQILFLIAASLLEKTPNTSDRKVSVFIFAPLHIHFDDGITDVRCCAWSSTLIKLYITLYKVIFLQISLKVRLLQFVSPLKRLLYCSATADVHFLVDLFFKNTQLLPAFPSKYAFILALATAVPLWRPEKVRHTERLYLITLF